MLKLKIINLSDGSQKVFEDINGVELVLNNKCGEVKLYQSVGVDNSVYSSKSDVIKCKNSLTFNKEDLGHSLTVTDSQFIKHISNLSWNEFKIQMNGFELEALYIPHKSFPHQKLYVFLSAGGRFNPNTQFQRWSWVRELDGDLLVLEDPTYKKILSKSKRTITGWYFGDENLSYLTEISKLIDDLKSTINYSKIVFSGTSAGGYAALYLADKISNTTAIVGNPQIRICKWNQYKLYPEIHKFENTDKYNRFDLSYISKNKQSRFIIVYNCLSYEDKEQISFLSMSQNPGLKFINPNLILFGLESFYKPGHIVLFDVNGFMSLSLFSDILEHNPNDSRINNFASTLISEMSLKFNAQYKLDCQLIYSKIINHVLSIDSSVRFNFNQTDDHINVYFNNFGLKYRYDFMIEKADIRRCAFGIHIELSALNSQLENDVKNLTTKFNLSLSKNNFVFKASTFKIGYDDAILSFCDLIFNSYKSFYNSINLHRSVS